GGWSAGTYNQDQWLQVEFPKINVVTEVITQGSNRRNGRVTSYRVLSSMDGVKWIERGQFSEIPFSGDANTKLYNKFTERFIAKYVRINPLTWSGDVEVRVGYLGCDYSKYINLNESFDNTFPPIVLNRIIDNDFNTCMNIP
ncbi:unnamed protein product, partial [Owenia fusiformis]